MHDSIQDSDPSPDVPCPPSPLSTARSPAEEESQWQRLVESCNPGALIVVIESRLSPALKAQVPAEDIWQETLLHAWRDRASHKWCGVRAFRAWLLSIAENRIRDNADRIASLKRGGGKPALAMPGQSDDGERRAIGPSGRTPSGGATPSRCYARQDLSRAMQAALSQLQEPTAMIVRLRIFEQRTVTHIATAMGMSEASVRYWLRIGAERYLRLLHGHFSRSKLGEFASLPRPNASSQGGMGVV